MYHAGLSIGDIATFYGMTRQAMWKILQRRKVLFRPQLRQGMDNHFFRGTRASDRAQNILELAIEKGIVERKVVCETCGIVNPRLKDGRTAVQSHHLDYNKPLDVMWLCQKCHHEWHKVNKAIPIESLLPSMTRKQIASMGGKASAKVRWGK